MIRPWMVVLLGLAIGAQAPDGQALKPVVAQLPDGTHLDVYDASWAVLIGIDKYRHWPRLEYAVRDVADRERQKGPNGVPLVQLWCKLGFGAWRTALFSRVGQGSTYGLRIRSMGKAGV